ncbi:ATP-binding protein [Salipiger sp. 1_MG-2023]|uniref:ATP-binding response regulator n=1 Tax=Salipiger sp. 1_MG-2023 TaxID=3062665 RepID=UPI0026E34FEA|nr:ATP-binding protein [Salipiger sp. 1_MG-2023]MDO6585888.1 ATP-binding protein [Salipiger sp. 1_MG-2023]
MRRRSQWTPDVLRSAAMLLVLALICGGVAVVAAEAAFRGAFLAAATAFAAMGMISAIGYLVQQGRVRASYAAIRRFAGDDHVPTLSTDASLTITYANPAAIEQLRATVGEPLSDLLATRISNADGLIHRLGMRSESSGFAREASASGEPRTALSLRRLDRSNLLWRFESDTLPAEGQDALHEPPVLTLGRSGAVLYMNGRARVVLGRRIKRLDEVLEDPPLQNGHVHHFITPEGPKGYNVRCVDTGIGRQEVILDAIEPVVAESSAADGFDDLPVPLLRLSPDGTILRANPGACKLLDAERADGRNMSEFMEGLGRSIRGWISEAAAGRGLHRSEFLRLTRSDREIFVQVTLTRVRIDGMPELVAVLNDATELKTLEAQFVQSQKMQAIGQLAGGVAHDFNNLLTAISGHCDLLLLRHDQGDPDYCDLVQINQNANRAAALVGQLLAFSRKQTLRPEILDLRDTLSDLTHLLNRLVGEKVQLTLSHDPVLPTIRGDRRQLEQVMMNLVVNARDAMPDGGEIHIETECRTLMEPLQRDRAIVEPGQYAVVRVSDQGVGIPQDKLQKVFEPFYTTKRTGEGTGLGLSTVYGIVKQTGGFIFVDSAVGEGSSFSLLFPAYEMPVTAQLPEKVVEKRKMPQTGSGVVLLVEDEAPVRAFAARALRMRGYTVHEAGTAEEALELLEDRDMKIDLFVTDVVMPGMDGPSWVREALKQRPGTRVVFVSGYAEDVFAEGEAQVPNSIFLPKPFSLNQLTETVHLQLN